MAETMCHCGKPLHYSDANIQRVIEGFVREFGEYLTVTVDGRSFRVPRHYIALHGLKGEEVPRLGFEEIREL